MGVRIRLQDHGNGKSRYWWIVVQRTRKNIKGRFVQKVGYWVPHMKWWHQRRIAINRHALRYWIRVGAEPTLKVQWLMWNAGMMPKPWLPYGTQTMYEREPKTEGVTKRIMNYKGFYPKQAEYYKKIRNTEEENLMMRRVKAEQHVQNMNNLILDPLYDFTDVDIGEIKSDDETEFGRTQKVYHLNNKLKDLDKESINLPSSRRQLIIQKIKRLTHKGIMADQEYRGLVEKSLKDPANQGKIQSKNVMLLNSLDKIRTMELNIENLTEAMEPVNRDDIILHLRKNTKLDEREILTVTDEMMEYCT